MLQKSGKGSFTTLVFFSFFLFLVAYEVNPCEIFRRHSSYDFHKASSRTHVPFSELTVDISDYMRVSSTVPFPARAFMVTTQLAYREGRTAHALRQVEQHLPGTRVELIFGSVGNYSDLDFGCESTLKQGTTECRMGLNWAVHQIWKTIAREGLASGLVLQDDVLFHDDFKLLLPKYWSRVPPDFEIVYLGCAHPWLLAGGINGASTAPNDFVRFGAAPYMTHAYVLTAASASRFAALYTQLFRSRGRAEEPRLPELSPVDVLDDLFLNSQAFQTALDKSKWVSFESILALPAKWHNISFLGYHVFPRKNTKCECDNEYTNECRGFLPIVSVGLAYQHYHCHNMSRFYSWIEHYQADLLTSKRDGPIVNVEPWP
jgi:hypothetical protein